MTTPVRITICTALLGLAVLSSPVLAQQKTVKACQDEWRANKADNQAKGITEKGYVAQCRTGGPAAQPASVPAAKPTPAPVAATKTVKTCQDEWRANKAAYQTGRITEKVYVAKCRAGETVALPTTPPTTAPTPAPTADSDDRRSDDRRSETRHTSCHPGSQAIPDGSAVASHRRRSVSDRSPGKIPVSSRSCRVGKSPFEDLSLCRSQELRDDQSRRLHVREGGNCTGLPRFQNREAPERITVASVLYRCPTTGKNVQASFNDDSLDGERLTYVSLRCPACTPVHLVNRAGETPDDKH